MHYKLNQRDDSEFWQDRAAMSIPARLSIVLTCIVIQRLPIRPIKTCFESIPGFK